MLWLKQGGGQVGEGIKHLAVVRGNGHCWMADSQNILSLSLLQ
jgi:hypothetical protein